MDLLTMQMSNTSKNSKQSIYLGKIGFCLRILFAAIHNVLYSAKQWLLWYVFSLACLNVEQTELSNYAMLLYPF